MSRSLSLVLVGYIALSLVESRLYFDATRTKDGTFLAYPKPKNGLEELGEDSYGSSPVGLVVCDGVGSGFLSSKYISEHITLAWTRFVNDYFIKGNGAMPAPAAFFDEAKKLLETEKTTYKSTVEQLKAQWSKTSGQTMLPEEFSLDSSTTFISGTLVEEGGNQRLLVVQKGDSLLTLYRRTAVADRVAYLPAYMTNEQQHFFNCPFQINSGGPGNPAEIYTYNLAVQAQDMVVIGSDGVFDNMGVGFMAMLVNDLIAFPTLTEEAAVNKLIGFARIYHWTVWYKKVFLFRFFTPTKEELQTKTFDRKAKWEALKDQEDPEKGFLKELDQFFADGIGMYGLPEKEVAAWRKYFECPVLELISMPEKYDEDPNILAECARKVIQDHLSGTPEQFAAFARPEMRRFRSEVIARVTYFFSHIPANFPSTFTIRGWLEWVINGEYGMGKPDDITVVASVLNDQPADQAQVDKVKEVLVRHNQENDEERATYAAKLTIDLPMVCYFYNRIAIQHYRERMAFKANMQSQGRGSMLFKAEKPAQTGDQPKKELDELPLKVSKSTVVGKVTDDVKVPLKSKSGPVGKVPEQTTEVKPVTKAKSGPVGKVEDKKGEEGATLKSKSGVMGKVTEKLVETVKSKSGPIKVGGQGEANQRVV